MRLFDCNSGAKAVGEQWRDRILSSSDDFFTSPYEHRHAFYSPTSCCWLMCKLLVNRDFQVIYSLKTTTKRIWMHKWDRIMNVLKIFSFMYIQNINISKSPQGEHNIHFTDHTLLCKKRRHTNTNTFCFLCF